MSRLLFILIVGVGFSTDVIAQSCPYDTTGVSRTSHQSTPTMVVCNNCRSVQDFPEDAVNAIANYFLHNTQGSTFRELFLEQPTVSGLEQVDVPVCNDHGQCGTGSFRANYNYFGLNYQGVKISVPTTLRDYTVSFRDVGGTSTLRQYPTNIGELAVPATADPDSIPDGECRYSNGDTRQADGNDGDDDHDRDDRGEQPPHDNDYYIDEMEEAYGGRVRTCGFSFGVGGLDGQDYIYPTYSCI